jgi:competence protein ComEC
VRSTRLAAVAVAAALAAWLAASAAAAASVRASGNLRIVWIDVDGGAATLVVAPGGESLLIDAGWPGERDAARIARAAAAEGVERIDHLVVTHFHTDHWGGVADLARVLPIARIYDRGLPDAGTRGVDRRIKPELRAAYLATTKGGSTVLAAGDTLPLAGVTVSVLCANARVAGEPTDAAQTRPCRASPAHPPRPDDETDNALGLGLLLTLGDFEFLVLGDLTWNVEHKLACPEDRIGAVDVYQASHHGFDDASHPALLAAARPTVAVIANGAEKGCSPDVVTRLRALPELADLFQLHRNVTTGPEANTAPELVANDDEDCDGHPIRLTLDPAGKSYTVEVPSKGTARTYPVRAR